MNGQHEPPELRTGELLGALERHRVRFLIIGGFAAQLHGATRQTKDLDLCPQWSQDNFDRLADALTELGARLRLPPELGDVEVLPNSKLLRETPVTHWRTSAGDVDVLIAIAGEEGKPVGFRELEPRAVTVHLGGVTVLVAGLEDIIAAKERANRPKDRAALPELRALHTRTTRKPPPAEPSPPSPKPPAASYRPSTAPPHPSAHSSRRPPALGR